MQVESLSCGLIQIVVLPVWAQQLFSESKMVTGYNTLDIYKIIYIANSSLNSTQSTVGKKSIQHQRNN